MGEKCLNLMKTIQCIYPRTSTNLKHTKHDNTTQGT